MLIRKKRFKLKKILKVINLFRKKKNKKKYYNLKIIKILKKFQLIINYKKKKSDFVIKNNFKMQPVKKSVRLLKKKLLYK